MSGDQPERPAYVEPTPEERAAVEALERHLTQCVIEYIACVNGPDEWKVYPETGRGPATVWDVDPADDTGPVVLVHRETGLRVEVDAYTSAGEARTTHRGLTPDDGWPT